MIVKSIGQRSSGAGGRILEYILRPEATIKDHNGNPIIIKHNLQGDTIAQWIQALKDNEAGRVYSHKNRNYYYHDIIALSALDKEHINVAILEDLTHKYLELRAEFGMGIASFHGDIENPHIHILLGATECITGKALRMSKEEFSQVKIASQEYQQQQYPQLEHSIVEHGAGKDWISNDEFRMKERTKQPSRKEELKEILKEAFDRSYSKDEFYSNISEQGLKLYERSGVMGIEDTRNYRLETLGVGEEQLQELDERSERLDQLKGIEQSQKLDLDISSATGLNQEDQNYETDEFNGDKENKG